MLAEVRSVSTLDAFSPPTIEHDQKQLASDREFYSVKKASPVSKTKELKEPSFQGMVSQQTTSR